MSAEPRDYQRLDALAVQATVDRLTQRIRARFPDRNLGEVSQSLSGAIDELLLRPRARWYAWLRVASRAAVVVLIAVLVIALVVLVGQAADDRQPGSVWEWVQIVESVINDIVFVSIAVFFLWQLPLRWERAHDLAALHKLRSLAHVIDMHQLTKDPDRLRADFRPTSQSVDIHMTAGELSNYLDYCSEMLSLVGKTAALFAEHSQDNTVLQTVDSIEDLTSGMGREIWQKIALLPGRHPRDIDAPSEATGYGA